MAADVDLLARLDPRPRDALGPLLAVGTAGPSGPMDPRELFEAVTHLVERAAARQPLLLVLEDFHWADEVSARLLAFLGRRLGPHRALVLVTAREEELPGDPSPLGRALEELARGRHLETLPLGPLSRAETAELVRRLALPSASVDELGTLDENAWRISEGNPFVVVETIQAYRQGGSRGSGSGLVLPDPVQAVVLQRLEGLSDRSRRLAAAAAVIGRESEFPLLRETAGLAEEEAIEAVEELVRRRLFRVSGERFALSHDRIRAVVYQRLLAPRRALLHRRAAEALEGRRGSGRRPGPVRPRHALPARRAVGQDGAVPARGRGARRPALRPSRGGRLV